MADEVVAQRELPAAVAHVLVLVADVAGETDDQAPGQLGGALPAPPLPQTVMPSSLAAAMSAWRFTMAVVVGSLRLGRRSRRLRGIGVRSRIMQMTSKGCGSALGLVLGQGFMKHGYLDVGRERRPVCGDARGVLVVVEDGKLGHGGLTS